MASRGTVTIGPLDSIPSVRRELARIYRAARLGELDTTDASKLGNLLAILGRLIESSELAQRVEALEAAAAQERKSEPWRN